MAGLAGPTLLLVGSILIPEWPLKKVLWHRY